jgi:hypothetical protein
MPPGLRRTPRRSALGYKVLSVRYNPHRMFGIPTGECKLP